MLSDIEKVNVFRFICNDDISRNELKNTWHEPLALSYITASSAFAKLTNFLQ